MRARRSQLSRRFKGREQGNEGPRELGTKGTRDQGNPPRRRPREREQGRIEMFVWKRPFLAKCSFESNHFDAQGSAGSHHINERVHGNNSIQFD